MNTSAFLTVDYVFLIIIGLSAFVGLWRGLIKEAFSLMTWIAAITLAFMFRDVPLNILNKFFNISIDQPVIAAALGALIIFVVAMLVGSTIANMVKKVITNNNLGFLNRILGLVFGIARALLIIVGLSIMVNFFLAFFNKNLADFSWWNQAQLTPYVEQIENKAFDKLMLQYQERQRNQSTANTSPESTVSADGSTVNTTTESERNSDINLKSQNDTKKSVLRAILDVLSSN